MHPRLLTAEPPYSWELNLKMWSSRSGCRFSRLALSLLLLGSVVRPGSRGAMRLVPVVDGRLNTRFQEDSEFVCSGARSLPQALPRGAAPTTSPAPPPAPPLLAAVDLSLLLQRPASGAVDLTALGLAVYAALNETLPKCSSGAGPQVQLSSPRRMPRVSVRLPSTLRAAAAAGSLTAIVQLSWPKPRAACARRAAAAGPHVAALLPRALFGRVTLAAPAAVTWCAW